MEFLRRLFGLSHQTTDLASSGKDGSPESLPLQDLSIVDTILKETVSPTHDWAGQLKASPRWQVLLTEPDTVQIAAMRAAIHVDTDEKGNKLPVQVQYIRNEIVSQLLRRALPFSDADLTHVATVWHTHDYGLEGRFPSKAILRAVEKLADKTPLSAELIAALKCVREKALAPRWLDQPPTRTHVEIADRIERLLGTAPAGVALPAGPFAGTLEPWFDALAPEPQAAWLALLALAAEAGDKAKPTRKWLDSTKAAFDRVGQDVVRERIVHWLDTTTPDPAIIDLSLDILKGLIWTTSLLPGQEVAGVLGRFCEKCFRKVPNYGARSVKLGNAALWALSERAGEPMAGAELIRLRDRIKYPSARKVIESRLAELAERTGQSVEALEDLSLPDFGIDGEGQLNTMIGDAVATICLSATDTELSWTNASGVALKSVPANVKRDHAAELTVLRNRAKEIEAARASQVTRLEASWLEDRVWRFEDWARHFRDHPLRRAIVAALIWKVDGKAVMTGDKTLRDVAGRPVAPGPDAEVRLWHPLDSTPDEVLAWRRYILAQGLTQPIKQAHREIYVLTDAERRTNIYSNRFAAHILRQHQFRALCQARGWTYGLMGGWDSHNVPERELRKVGLTVQFQVEAVDDGQRTDAYVAVHLSSDQVRFIEARNQPVPLIDVPPIIFSEALRDVDLFVAVTSVANDPGWTDGGPEGRFGGYWREWAFGDLGQSAQTRKELIAHLASRLSIRDRLEITDKFLVVTGKRQAYAIHFGSGNIQILPSNRYLCIVPDRPPAEAVGLKLPFTGDGMLSTILAKAFLLVDEDRITDQTIVSQL